MLCEMCQNIFCGEKSVIPDLDHPPANDDEDPYHTRHSIRALQKSCQAGCRLCWMVCNARDVQWWIDCTEEASPDFYCQLRIKPLRMGGYCIVALSGLAKPVHARLGEQETYLVGLFRGALVKQLIWRIGSFWLREVSIPRYIEPRHGPGRRSKGESIFHLSMKDFMRWLRSSRPYRFGRRALWKGQWRHLRLRGRLCQIALERRRHNQKF